MKLRGKTALVTGGGRGIGRVIAPGVGQESAAAGVRDSVADNAPAVTREIEATGVKALALPADLTKSAQVDRAVADTLAQFGQIDILVNNAGRDRMEMFLDSEEETWDKILAINLKGLR